MTYEKALDIIKTEFETRKMSPVHTNIRSGLTYDGCNGFCVCIHNSKNGIILTDLGETKEIFSDVPEEDWIDMCKKHGFEFVNWSITRKFIDLHDVDDFIKFLDFISWKYWED